MLDLDNLKSINEKLGYDKANFKIQTVGRLIKQFCDEKPTKTKGFRNTTGGKGDSFAILIRYCEKIATIERRIKGLLSDIESLTHETVSVGLVKMKTNETFKEWCNV